MKDEEAIDWREGFQNFHWIRRTSSRRVMEVCQGRKEYLVFGEGKGKGVCEKGISSYV
jgi:hypothetical protein